MSTLLSITPTRCVFGDFDTNKRYLRARSGADFPIAKGETFFMNTPTSGNNAAEWRYSVASYVLQSNSSTLTSNASSTLVTT